MKGSNIIVNIPPQEREIFASKFVLDLDFGDSALSALPEVVKLSREMELPPPHVLLQLDAIIVAQRESDGARVVATPSAAATPPRPVSRWHGEVKERAPAPAPAAEPTASGAAACSPAANSTISTSSARPRSSARSGARNIALRPEITGASGVHTSPDKNLLLHLS